MGIVKGKTGRKSDLGVSLPMFISPKGAIFDKPELHRYLLWRRWNPCGQDRFLGYCGLNPSKADHRVDDATIRVCRSRAQRLGYDGMVMLNLFTLRETSPAAMMAHRAPIGDEAMHWFRWALGHVEALVLCWGNDGVYQSRNEVILRAVQEHHSAIRHKTYHLGLTKSGQPKHPLRLRLDLPLTPWVFNES